MPLITASMDREKEIEAFVRRELAATLAHLHETMTLKSMSRLVQGEVDPAQIHAFIRRGIARRPTLYLCELIAESCGVWPPAELPFDLPSTPAKSNHRERGGKPKVRRVR